MNYISDFHLFILIVRLWCFKRILLKDFTEFRYFLNIIAVSNIRCFLFLSFLTFVLDAFIWRKDHEISSWAMENISYFGLLHRVHLTYVVVRVLQTSFGLVWFTSYFLVNITVNKTLFMFTLRMIMKQNRNTATWREEFSARTYWIKNTLYTSVFRILAISILL